MLSAERFGSHSSGDSERLCIDLLEIRCPGFDMEGVLMH
jgi:hypothetical protein